jgi:CTP synthase (UTP-ammonia lyase)
MPEIDAETMGGNMRLGARPTLLHPPHNAPNKEEGDARSLASLLYGGVESVSERHRHR